ncbi:MAG: hypothetical protein CVV64_02560 [Candidatus Wallbacteria bacterium HGW-Wallbacteria-1]|uniref:Uncharacterized protein n=1 Tax=Candidatus Wallbacteria bacterium HGW-Wallbacteria-1 TaxID=2013854 RepID=A0A2N1PVG4_9BACT|nr:MAG: hypothetical protein CVV64_02560 [Candidatus Wallbacteria bacterium HGW-Wallbacteria-1]
MPLVTFNVLLRFRIFPKKSFFPAAAAPFSRNAASPGTEAGSSTQAVISSFRAPSKITEMKMERTFFRLA